MALFSLRDFQIHNTDETTFGVDLGDSFSGRSVRCISNPVFSVDQQALDNPSLRQRLAGSAQPILGLRTGKITFSTPLRGYGVAAGDTIEGYGSADWADGQLLENAFGAESLGTGTTVNDESATTTIFDVTSAAGLAEGQAIMIGTEASVIGDITGSQITLVRALSSAPSNGATVYAGASFYPAETLTNTLQAQAIGAEDGYYRGLGCQADVKFNNLGPGQLPQLDYEFQCADWVKYSTASLSNASYTSTQNPPIPGYASSLYIQDYGTTTINEVHASAITIDPGITNAVLDSVSGVQGKQAWVRSVIAPTFEIQLNTWSMDWHDDFVNSTAKYIHYQIGSTPGNTILIEIQKAYLNAVPERSEINSQVGPKIKGVGREPTTGSGITLAPIKVHIL